MLAFLEGIIDMLESDAVVLAVGGVGYRIFTSRGVGETGEQTRLYLAEVIREDRHDLYGFKTREELAFFHRLISIDGVGPKMALKILASGTESGLRSKIQAGDLGFLTSISGVGKKTAQKIILELKGTLVHEESLFQDGDIDIMEALLGLGYNRTDVAAVLPKVKGERAEERVKHALQLLGRTR